MGMGAGLENVGGEGANGGTAQDGDGVLDGMGHDGPPAVWPA